MPGALLRATTSKHRVLIASKPATARAKKKVMPPKPAASRMRTKCNMKAFPRGVTGVSVSYEDPSGNPLHFRFKGDKIRYATEKELACYLQYHPYNYEHVSPEILRRILPNLDGELMALMVELREAIRAVHAEKTADKRSRLATERAAKFQAICEYPARTDFGVALKLEMLMDTTWSEPEVPISIVQQRQLLWNSLVWLRNGLMDRKGSVKARSIKASRLVEHLKFYREDAEAKLTRAA